MDISETCSAGIAVRDAPAARGAVAGRSVTVAMAGAPQITTRVPGARAVPGAVGAACSRGWAVAFEVGSTPTAAAAGAVAAATLGHTGAAVGRRIHATGRPRTRASAGRRCRTRRSLTGACRATAARSLPPRPRCSSRTQPSRAGRRFPAPQPFRTPSRNRPRRRSFPNDRDFDRLALTALRTR